MTAIDMHGLSDAEIDAVTGGLQYNDNPQVYVVGLVVMPDPGFGASPAKPDAERPK